MPFGLSNSPATYQQVTKECLGLVIMKRKRLAINRNGCNKNQRPAHGTKITPKKEHREPRQKCSLGMIYSLKSLGDCEELCQNSDDLVIFSDSFE